MEGWNAKEKTVLLGGILIIAAVLVGFMFFIFIVPTVEKTTNRMQSDARDAAEKDSKTLQSLSAADRNIAGSWSRVSGSTGATVIYEFKDDGTGLWYYGNSAYGTDPAGTGHWGRLKGTNALVYREGSGRFYSDYTMSYDTGSDTLTISGRKYGRR